MNIRTKMKIFLSTINQTNERQTKHAKKTYIYLDESGHLISGDNQRYFVIGGIITTNPKELRKMHKNVSTLLRFKKGVEYKSSKMNGMQRNAFISEVSRSRHSRMIVLSFDKTKWSNIDDKDAVLNYLIRRLLKYLNRSGLYEMRFPKNIELVLDQRKSFVGEYRSLRSYLSREFTTKNISVFQASSSSFPELQWADVVANSYYKFINKRDGSVDFDGLVRQKKMYISIYPRS